MRNTFAKLLLQKTIGKDDREISPVLITGDLGFSVLEPLREAMGKSFINVGVAEALMTSMAAGIASEGNKVFTYSIVPFATFRCLEQIRNDVCYHNLDVTIVGVGAGFGYGSLGPTHHATEDVAAIWALPNMTVYNPACVWQTEQLFEHAWKLKGPKYFRIGKGGEGRIAEELVETIAPGVYRYQRGSLGTIVCTGNVLSEVWSAFEGMDVEIISVAILKPLPIELLRAVSNPNVLCIDELNNYGGFSAQLSLALLGSGFRGTFAYLNTGDSFAKTVGDLSWQRREKGLSAETLLQRAKALGFC